MSFAGLTRTDKNFFNTGNSFNMSTSQSPSFADVYKFGVADSFVKDNTSKGFLDK